MTATISVRVEGPVGLDEPEELLTDLGRETGLEWRLDASDEDGGTLDGGLSEALLIAVLSSATSTLVQAAAQRAIDNWRGRRLDPPPVTIVVVPPPPPSPPPIAADGDGPATPEGS
ncbi:hypothetical protein [Streptomyces sp. NPDC050264]|uniref:hypothetical protein n=1 Tax=Streptomyces sp. NPDC050264 TaxID=3155038 RepID=UPI00342DFFE5